MNSMALASVIDEVSKPHYDFVVTPHVSIKNGIIINKSKNIT
jgi:hypothetical protein